ncbi:MAG: 1-acyl-sn-glycerol-3-phosphate acyltransferase, partial [Myxococcota bacterium]
MSPSVSDVLDTPHFREGLGGLAAKHELPLATVEDRARRALEAMWTRHDPWASGLWRRFGHLVSKRYALEVDEEGLHQVAELDRRHPLVLLFSHRSYLDTWLLRDAVDRAGLAPIIALAGANLSFWPMGAVIRRTGGLFIRRDAKDDDVYRYALRGYMRYLLETQQNLGWSIEGGRTRTGKLRPPRFGALSYVVDSLRSSTGPEVYIIPVSVVYDQLGEVATLAGEALGGRKRPEDLRWLMEFSATQARVGGTARVDFGEPLPLREHILALEADPKRRPVLVERVALETCHRINRVTPPTASAVVTLALLGAGRALTLEEITATVDPLLEHLLRPPHPPLMGVDPSAAPTEWIHESLEQLLAAGVVERFDGGESAVYYIAPNQHLVAAFYRNTL